MKGENTMSGTINGFDYLNMDAQKYWSFPASYDKAKRQAQLNVMLYSNDYLASEKRDGYWQMVLKDDDKNVYMRARSAGVNGWVCKQDWVPHLHDFFDALPRGTCLVCEVYLPGKTSRSITTILGCGVEKAIERQSKDCDKLRLSVFDVLSYHGMNLHSQPISERIKFLEDIRAMHHPFVDVVDYWVTPDEIHDNWLRILSAGGEGVVLTRKDNPYEFGKRTARHTLKLKKELQETIDVFLTGNYKEPTRIYTGKEIENWEYWYNEITGTRHQGKVLQEHADIDGYVPVTRLWFNKWAGAVEIATILDGKVVPIGWISGVSDEVRAGIVENPDSYKGLVVELQAMEIDHSGPAPTLRHAKIVNWRSDKDWKSCEWIGK